MYTYIGVHISLGGMYIRDKFPIRDVGVHVMLIEINVFQCYIYLYIGVITRLYSALKLSSILIRNRFLPMRKGNLHQ